MEGGGCRGGGLRPSLGIVPSRVPTADGDVQEFGIVSGRKTANGSDVKDGTCATRGCRHIPILAVLVYANGCSAVDIIDTNRIWWLIFVGAHVGSTIDGVAEDVRGYARA